MRWGENTLTPSCLEAWALLGVSCCLWRSRSLLEAWLCSSETEPLFAIFGDASLFCLDGLEEASSRSEVWVHASTMGTLRRFLSLRL